MHALFQVILCLSIKVDFLDLAVKLVSRLNITLCMPDQNGFEAGGRFEGLAQTLLPPAPPGVPPSPAHLAAIQPHQVL